MGRTCAVPGCNSGRAKSDKVSMFTVPSRKRDQWSNILKCVLKDNAKVCEKHFHESDIKSGWTECDENGTIRIKVS